MNDCIFCKIVKGEIPSNKTYQDENFIAFLDIHPKAPGHTLLVPKAHYPWFIDVPEKLSEEMFRNAHKISKELKETYKADYIRLGIVGTDIPHTHIHLIPLKLETKKEGLDTI
jgi:histidine triad (HIT) family protein